MKGLKNTNNPITIKISTHNGFITPFHNNNKVSTTIALPTSLSRVNKIPKNTNKIKIRVVIKTKGVENIKPNNPNIIVGIAANWPFLFLENDIYITPPINPPMIAPTGTVMGAKGPPINPTTDPIPTPIPVLVNSFFVNSFLTISGTTSLIVSFVF